MMKKGHFPVVAGSILGLLTIGLVGALTLLEAGAAWADHVFSPTRSRVELRTYPVTELRMVREPGNYHFIQANDGEYILSDYWWREVKVGERRYTGGPGGPVGGPPPYGGPGGPGAFQARKVFVEIISGKGREFFSRERIRPTSFTLIEDLPRNVTIRFGNSRGTLNAVYDGYHVDLGLENAAKVVPGFNGVPQMLGDGPGIEDVVVSVYWEEDERGDVIYYREAASYDSSGAEADTWGSTLKSKVISKQKQQPQQSQPAAPSAPPAQSPN
ncbi:MAG: hypothetical protein HUU16_07660 [Candidatus Omnitrophica bacterium]|nr:hypothetical protein [bacterium]NUN96036.1 hypothetical protein [Candidatus Omnitrophota bacterium]